MILVTGANGVVGAPLCERLQREGIEYVSVTRAAAIKSNQVQWDLHKLPSDTVKTRIENATVLIHCAPIWLLSGQLEQILDSSIKRLVVFSSTSVLAKRDSKNMAEQRLVQQLSDSEHAISTFCKHNDIGYTIFRPSLIYGYGRDQNISRIANFIRRFRFMLLVGEGVGMRQPVHADDLVDASLYALNKPASVGRVYNLAGGETLSYRAMVERIAIGLGQRPRVVHLPLWLFRAVLTAAAKLSKFSYTPEMADRMNNDLVYDISDAVRDLRYTPQAFLEHPARDLNLVR